MKKVLALSLILALVSIAASAQQGRGERMRRFRMEQGFNHGQITRPERFHMRKDQLRFKIAQHRSLRDGFVSPMGRRRLMMLKRHELRQRFFFMHNNRRRLI